MLCHRCKVTITDVYNRVETLETYRMGTLNRTLQSNVFHPACFIDESMEFADTKLKSEVEDLKRENQSLKAERDNLAKENATLVANICAERDSATASFESCRVLRNDVKKYEQLLFEQGKRFSGVEKLKAKLIQTIKSLDGDDDDRFAIQWTFLWVGIGFVVQSERTIKEVVNKHNETVLRYAALEAQKTEMNKELAKTKHRMHGLERRLDDIRQTATQPF